MKIRKVEIQAFRAYDEVKDGTFDFSLKDGRVADFVSLYAPNGFGKTSFYDAVEWGVTKNIYRFTRQDINKAYAHDEKQLKYELAPQKSPHYILRNKNSPPERASFVKLDLQGFPNITGEELEELPRKDSSDYLFNEKATQNIYFRDVILSQDNIDAFLKEDDPHQRYKKFMDFFGDKELDRYFTNILCLIRANDQKISGLEAELDRLRQELPLDTDNQILEKVNQKINDLAAQGEQMNQVLPTYTEQDFITFSNHISDRKIVVNHQKEATAELLTVLESNQSKIVDFLILRSRIRSEQGKMAELERFKSVFEQQTKLNNELSNKALEINKTTAEIKKTQELIDKLPAFTRALSSIAGQQEEIKNQRDLIARQEIQLADITKQFNSLNAQLNSANTSLYNLSQKQSEIEGLKETSESSEREATRLRDQIKNETAKIATIDQKIQVLTEAQAAFESDIREIGKNNFSEALKKDSAFSAFIANIDLENQKLKELNTTLKKIEEEISQSNVLNNELKQIITITSGYINKTQSPTCPVCLHEYDNFEELSQRVLNNPLLDVLVQEKLTRKNDLTGQITAAVDDVAAARSEMLKLKNEQLLANRTEFKDLNLEKTRLSLELTNLRNALEKTETRIRDIFVKTEGVTISEYQKKISDNITQKNSDVEQTNKKIDEQTKASNELKAFIEAWNKTLTTLESGIKAYRASEDYLLLDNYIRRNGLDENVTADYFNDLLLNLNRVLTNYRTEEKELQSRIKVLADTLSQQNVLSLDGDIKDLRDSITVNKEVTDAFERFLNQHFSNIPNVDTQDILDEHFDTAQTEARQKINDVESLLANFEKLEDYKNNVLPYLKFKATELLIANLEKSILQQKEVVGVSLVTEKDKLSAFINLQIESFFYEDLINQLYKKVDPHPEYKKIKFKCDFHGDKPKLNVFVTTGNEDIHLIPNLYFSTAQMNILSLSIFLAKALNAHDEAGNAIDCIFIDDPIQSMDSINILSTIDLLRSIVVNFDKQIILSTHDENFFYLLQRKIPTDLFNSKFVELETFGKVKSEK
ncbi:exonuclease SbcC [Mucilaginibacter frigoritolerans]|uniref:Exonuclease SbcC n=1 Tax=Mucilaginibacter frigoritolerans TaxID=652788 RepID=A0A562UH47_9SPHI|nr:AAA family ATPase [Mucilaginibacter frigoritolerans]TWJ04949.1 exonuclease SbcC [Mucilaginibacter frigoritolerans]